MSDNNPSHRFMKTKHIILTALLLAPASNDWNRRILQSKMNLNRMGTTE